MSLSILKGALAVLTACSLSAGTGLLPVGAGKKPPSPKQVATTLPRPGDDKSLENLLDQYSKAYADCKSVRRTLANAGLLPPQFAASQRDLLAQRESICQQSAPGNSAHDIEESKRDAELGNQLLRLATQRLHWQDSVKIQADKQLAANTKALDRVTLTLRQALAAKRKGFKFQLHGITYQAYVVDLNDDKIELHLDQDSVKHAKFTSLERLREHYKQLGQSPAMITNAGMFHANQEPVGLLISNGVVINPLNVQKPATDENFYLSPNGVFFIDSHNVGRIDSTGGYQRQWEARQRQHEVREATQSGPMLVINNRLNSHFSELSTNAKVRSGVGIINQVGNTGSRVIFLATDGGSTFYDFSTTFRDLFGCSNALFLDGAISRMYLAGEQTNYTGGFFGPMVSVISRTSVPKGSSDNPPVLSTAAKQPSALPESGKAPAAIPGDTASNSALKKPAAAKTAPPSAAPASQKDQRRPNPRKGNE
ncbi:phosphodiester glycosidase family protein [Hymenobacter terricola]|uniref:phosphodiester glycosidase family protein n=1 Tax=Hymenobacter terricola TaxID=2819236 RepID=UPI001B313440|nr:phosphodiester glycosidase family protein [Hymenobacter terricola]